MGENLSKFQGVELPGGITLDGSNENKDTRRDNKIRRRIKTEFEMPVMDMMG